LALQREHPNFGQIPHPPDGTLPLARGGLGRGLGVAFFFQIGMIVNLIQEFWNKTPWLLKKKSGVRIQESEPMYALRFRPQSIVDNARALGRETRSAVLAPVKRVRYLNSFTQPSVA